MNVISVSNNYNAQPYKTTPIKRTTFKGLFSKSLQEKFNDGIAALDNNSVFIFAPEEYKDATIYQFNEMCDKIDIPIFKTYSYFPTKEELPKYETSACFGIYKNGEKYYIASLNRMFALCVGYKSGYNKETAVDAGTIREIKSGEKITINQSLIDNDTIVFEFTPQKMYKPHMAENYMEVNNRFSDKKSVSKFNKATIAAFSRKADKSASNSVQFTFADVGGLEEQKEELRKYILRPLAYPDVYKNIRLNKGILLYGPPRCGKTLIGKALANEADIKYKYINANEWITGTVGSSEQNIRNSFNSIMETPSIIFIDEFDAVGKQRDGSANARYQDPVVNQILGCMSELEKSYTNSFVIAATNRKDLLDEALLATGRFGLHLEVPMPDEKALESIYNIHSKNKPFDDDVSKPEIVKLMFDNCFNGSDVAEMITVGYMNALERLGMNRKMDAKIFRFDDLKNIKISTADLKDAILKINKLKSVK